MQSSTETTEKPKTYSCNLCDSKTFTWMFDEPPVFGESFSLIRCDECGLISTFPAPSDQFLEKLYSPTHYKDHTVSGAYCSDEMLSSSDFDPVLARISTLVQGSGTLLDVGCGRGLFLNRAVKIGWDVRGIEPSPYAGGIARETLGERVRIGFFDRSAYPPRFFDVVTLWYVLEHVPNPRAILQLVFDVLKPGGMVFAAVPNWHYLAIRRHLGKLKTGRHGLIHAHEHLHQFTSNTAREMFRRVGFEVSLEMCASPYLVSGRMVNNAKQLAHLGVRALFQMTGRNMSGILLFGRKPLH